jgi:hypothetical protein
MKNSSDTIGNRTRDLPVSSAVPQPTAPPRPPVYYILIFIFFRNNRLKNKHSERSFSKKRLLKLIYRYFVLEAISDLLMLSSNICASRHEQVTHNSLYWSFALYTGDDVLVH